MSEEQFGNTGTQYHNFILRITYDQPNKKENQINSDHF